MYARDAHGSRIYDGHILFDVRAHIRSFILMLSHVSVLFLFGLDRTTIFVHYLNSENVVSSHTK